MTTTLPSHIASLDQTDIDLYLAWVKFGGNPVYTLDMIQDSFIISREDRQEVVTACVHEWMNRHDIDWDDRIPIDYTTAIDRITGECGYCAIVEHDGGWYAFLRFDINAR